RRNNRVRGRRGRHDAIAARRGGSRHQKLPHPRRFAPPLLDEEGKGENHSPPAKEGQRRRVRGAEGWFTKPKTSPPRRYAPPRLDEERRVETGGTGPGFRSRRTGR